MERIELRMAERWSALGLGDRLRCSGLEVPVIAPVMVLSELTVVHASSHSLSKTTMTSNDPSPSSNSGSTSSVSGVHDTNAYLMPHVANRTLLTATRQFQPDLTRAEPAGISEWKA